MKTATRLISSAVLLTSAFFVSSALACTTDAWSSIGGAPLAEDPLNGVNRVSGFCGMKVTGNEHVVDNSPAAETTFIGRFYVYPKNIGAGAHEIFAAYSDEAGTKNIVITYDGTNINLDATAFDGGGTVSVAADATHWNQVEFLWTSGAEGSIWVNADATVDPASGTFASGTGSIEQVRLGAVSDIGAGNALFDDYESHRSLPVGPLLVGDSNNDKVVNGLDISGILKESNAFTPELQSGTPDCNLDGSVSGLDISGILKAADAFNPVLCGS